MLVDYGNTSFLILIILTFARFDFGKLKDILYLNLID